MAIIGTIRKHSWIAVVLVGVATLAFILGDFTKRRGGMPDVGKIDGQSITYSHFDYLYNNMKAQVLRNQGITALSNEQEYQVREQVWQNLVQESILGKEYSKLGIALTPAEISDMYTGEFIHPYLKQMFTDPQTGVYQTQAIQYYTENFEDLDTLQKLQWVDLERSVTQDRELQKYNVMISQAMYFPKAMAQKIAELNNNSSEVCVAALSYQNIPDEDAVPTEADYKAYYNEHKAEYHIYEEMRQVDYVIFPINPTAQDYAQIEQDVNNTWAELQTMDTASALDFTFFVNNESAQSYDSTWHHATDFLAPLDSVVTHTPKGGYIAPRVMGDAWVMGKVQDIQHRPDSLRASTIWIMNQSVGGNITRSDEQAKAIADSVMAQLRSGKLTFEQAVQQYSDNKENNGDMGWATDGGYGFLNEKIVETPVNGFFLQEHPQKYGYMIVMVTGKTVPQQKYRVALITKNIVASDQTEKDIYNAANQFAGQNRTYAAMIAAAQDQNLQVHSDNVSIMSQTLQGVQQGREAVRWAFHKDVEAGMVADQIFTVDNAYVVCGLKDILKKGYATQEQAQPYMEQAVRLQKKGDIALAKAKEAVKVGGNMTSIATALNTTTDTVADVTFNSYYFGRFGMEPKAQAAVAVNAAKNNTQVLEPVRGASAVYVMQIQNVNKDGNTQADGIQNYMIQTAGQKGQSLLQVLRIKANIKDQRDNYF